MSEQHDDAQPPIETQDPDGWVRRTYRDGNFTRRKKTDRGMLVQYSWDFAREGVPEAVREQDMAAMREAGRSAGYAREEAFWKAFLGDS